MPSTHAPPDPSPLRALLPRAVFGGSLMGLANLVPGISGGTMLLAAGIYPAFIEAIADVTRLRIRVRPVVILATVAGCGALAILLLAGATKTLVVEQRWIMYSLFIGLTLGGVPLVWRLARPLDASVAIGATVGLAVMVAMALAPGGSSVADGPDTLRLVLSGVAGSAAMILPGVSGGYLLLLLGQYVPILTAIEQLEQALLGGGLDFALVAQASRVVVPVGIGVVLGVVVVSNLVEAALERFPKPTLGLLLGLLIGAVVGLWPFQEGVRPEPGTLHRGVALSAEAAAAIAPEDWPVHGFRPGPGQALAAGGLILLGLLGTTLVDRLGGGRSPSETG